MRDETGYPIPAAIEDDWRRADKIGRELVAKLTTIIEDIEAHIRRKDLIVAELHDANDLRQARTALERIIPYSVCTTCQGQTREKCTFCKQRGYISKFLYDICVPIEVKELRARSIQAQTWSAF
jgi:hypothetical protein